MLAETVTTPVFRTLETLVDGIPGWSELDQLYTLHNLVYLTSHLDGDILEIGSFCGRSTVALALAAGQTGEARVFAVDLFPERSDWRRNPDGSYSFSVRIGGRQIGGYEEQTVWEEPFLRNIAPLYERSNGLLEIFRQTLDRLGLERNVVAFRGDSSLFVQTLPRSQRFRFVFLDGDHSYEAVRRDIENVESYLAPGAWIGFDDAFSCYDGVNRAIQEMILVSGKYELGRQFTRKFFAARRKADA